MSLSCDIEPPVFVKKLADVTAKHGEEVTLKASVRGAEPMSLSWVKDKAPIVNNDIIKISFENNQATLKILKAHPSTSGKYCCLLKNDAGSAESFATVTVLGSLKSLNLSFKSVFTHM